MKFPVNVETVTIWEKTVIDRAPAYLRHEIGPAYWQEIQLQELDGISRNPDNSVFLAVPADAVTYLPKKDDRVVSGSCPDSSPPKTALTVMQVKDFRYLLPKMMHIEVILK